MIVSNNICMVARKREIKKMNQQKINRKTPFNKFWELSLLFFRWLNLFLLCQGFLFSLGII